MYGYRFSRFPLFFLLVFFLLSGCKGSGPNQSENDAQTSVSETIPSSEDSQDESSNEGIAVNAEVTFSPSSNITVGQNVNFTVKLDSVPGLVTIQYGSGLEEKPMDSSEDGLTWTYTRTFDSAGEKTITVRAYDTSSKGNVIDTETINMTVVEGTTPQPAAPTNLIATTPGDGQVSLSWGGVSSATSYRVYYATSSVALDNATLLNTPTTNPIIIGLTNGTRYYFRVTAVNANNQESTPSDEVSVTPMPPVPGAPTNITANPGDGQVSLSWGGVSSATSYHVYYATSSVALDNATLLNTPTTNPIISGLTNDTRYYFRVTAVNAINQESTPSGEVFATPTPPVPGAPTNITANPGDGQVSLSWGGVSSATNYRVYYATSSAGLDNAIPLNTPNTNRIISGLTNDTRYYFRVTAANASNQESTPSGEVFATPTPHVPSAPTNITAFPVNHQVNLNWGAVAYANSYSICYAKQSITTFTTSEDCYKYEEGKLLRDIQDTRETIAGLTNGTKYFFRVKAFGTNDQESAASSEVSATPLLRVKLNDTGITWGGDDGNNSTCTGETIAQQDCSHGRDAQAAAGTLSKVGGGAAGFDFTKLDSYGNDYAGSGDYARQPWFCVRDNHTGLIWEVKIEGFEIRGRERAYTAIASQQDRVRNYWDTLVEHSNSTTLCGFSDWRVPTLMELDSIVDAGRVDPSIDSNYFPNTISKQYWSSSPYVGDSTRGWFVNFKDGSYRYDGVRTHEKAVRLVRGGQ